ncbi:MAG TPA: molybdopterin-dependent oxidoreductase [Micropepsaceae bacterium]|jgi:DMSO/TMAO reductase YedYZ molybdopterin-dependent catalytic subunit|nr:molybdopterin-dependent oxidoreductase [Micropepsaceae bacterium]
MRLSRRQLIVSGTASLILGGCDRLSAAPSFQQLLNTAEGLSYRAQRAVMRASALAPQFAEKDISKVFRPNGSQDSYNLPPEYADLAHGNFAQWRLQVDGLVQRPAQFSLADLRALNARTQITRHDCVEGWSCIGKWTGPPLSAVLDRVGLKPQARFIVFHCADEVLRYVDGTHSYYESIDLIDAYHPQTILAYEMNGAPLPLANGAPLRLRVERQLGYKMAKFISRIEAVDRFDNIGQGHGGYWEDDGYEWYAGI